MTVERILAWYRVGSSVGAVVALIVANLVPLIGVLFLGWSVWNILIVYWLENGIVGAFNVLKMATAQGTGLPEGMTATQPPGRRNQEDEAHPVLHRPLRPVLGGARHLRADPAVPVHRGARVGVRCRSGHDPVRRDRPRDQPRRVVLVELPARWRVPPDQRRAADVRPVRATARAPHDDHPRRASRSERRAPSRRRWRSSSRSRSRSTSGCTSPSTVAQPQLPKRCPSSREPDRRCPGGVRRGPRDLARVARGQPRHVGRRVARHVADASAAHGTALTRRPSRRRSASAGSTAPPAPSTRNAASSTSRRASRTAAGRQPTRPASSGSSPRAAWRRPAWPPSSEPGRTGRGSSSTASNGWRCRADLAAALDAHPPAAANFAAFPPSVRKQLLTSLVMARRPETRAERVRRIAEAAARNERTPA